MGAPRPALSLVVTILSLACLPLHATPTAHLASPAVRTLPQPATPPDAEARNSLRADATMHPAEYLTFETHVAARNFLSSHDDASPETDRKMILNGIVGYWRGKTLAVLPSLPSASSR